MTRTAPTCHDGAASLIDLGLIRARGADAAKFLQGQLTNDFLLLGPDRARLAGYCSPKGRLLASFVGWISSAPDGEDEVMLLCSADLLAPTLKRLSMYVMRAQCRLDDASAEFQCLGLAGPSAKGALAGAAPAEVWGKACLGAATVIRLPSAPETSLFLWIAPQGALRPEVPAMGLSDWHEAEVRSGIPRITAATADQFIPQMLNLDLIGGVDFKKGCYPGQEVVARSQYRGTVKRRCLMFSVQAQARAGEEIFHSADPDQPAGQVVNATELDSTSTTLLLAEVKLAALPSGTLHLGSPTGPILCAQSLPYDVFLGTGG